MREFRIIRADVLYGLRELPDGCARCCVTSPPYWGLRDYGTGKWNGGDHACDHREVSSQNRPGRETPGGRGGSFPTTERGYRGECRKCGALRVDSQIGLEPTPEQYVARLVGVFREVRRVLRDDGTLWLNLGDSYNSSSQNNHGKGGQLEHAQLSPRDGWAGHRALVPGLKVKDLVGIPWLVAFALRADGWWLRSEIIWHKRAPMPESVQDRPTRSHEQLFLLSKRERYHFDGEAVREPDAGTDHPRSVLHKPEPSGGLLPPHRGIRAANGRSGNGRNIRSVWTLGPEPFPDAHFATFPTALVEPCIKAGSAEGDLVLDPFAGSGTTGVVALRLNRRFVGVELNPEYAEMSRRRIHGDAPLLNQEASA